MLRTGSTMNQTAKENLQRTGKGVMGQTFHHGINTESKKIGSIKTGQINYTRDHTFYHGETILPPNVREAVKSMKDLTDKDLLCRKKPEWIQSNNVPNLETVHESFNQPVSIEKKLFEIKAGLRDETILKAKDAKVYPGTDTRDAYYDGWNVSIQCPIPLHQAKYLEEE